MSIEMVSCCEQFSCTVCRKTQCKCAFAADDFFQLFQKRYFSAYQVYPSSDMYTQDWPGDDNFHKQNKESFITGACGITRNNFYSSQSDFNGGSSDECDSDDDMAQDDIQDPQKISCENQSCSWMDSDPPSSDPLHSLCQQKLSLCTAPGGLLLDNGDRKLSDSAVIFRRKHISLLQNQQRRFSDGNVASTTNEEESEFGSSFFGDSESNGDSRSRFHSTMTAFTSSDADDGASSRIVHKTRRLTPYPLSIERDACQLVVSNGGCGSHIIAGHKSKWLPTKHHSVSSIGGVSVGGVSVGGASVGGTSVGGTSTGGTSTGGASSESTSLWDCTSPETVTDILSSLGFEDFENPQLIPDRFIPTVVEHAKPSVMRLQGLLEDVPGLNLESGDLPLGATAEIFLQKAPSPPDHSSPPPIPMSNPVPIPLAPQQIIHSMYIEQTFSQFNHAKFILEPVPEETASDLSPSPRWFSPRVSIDHSVDLLDLQEGKLGSALLQKQKRRSFPQRDGYKLSIGSQVESEPDSIYFSITSYDEDIAREREKEREELCPPPLADDPVQQRRRRRGVYTPPPGLMTWLSSQQPISEVHQDPEELPWPFNEQACLRKSLTEIEQAQKSSSYEVNSLDQSHLESSSPATATHAVCVKYGCRSQQFSDVDRLSPTSNDSCDGVRTTESLSSLGDDLTNLKQADNGHHQGISFLRQPDSSHLQQLNLSSL